MARQYKAIDPLWGCIRILICKKNVGHISNHLFYVHEYAVKKIQLSIIE
jgi:hypothetical protein